MNRGLNASRSVPYLVTAFACMTLPNTLALAQQNSVASGYEVTESNVASPAVAAQNAGPVRMARFSLVTGKINCRPSTKVDWAPAYLNQPIRQGEQILVPANSRAEIMFDDGSIARLGGGAFVTLQTLYSDNQGEFTEVKLNDGLATFRLKNKVDVYQVDSPCCSIKSTGPAEFRIGARSSCEVADRKGNCTVEDSKGQVNLNPGQFVEVHHTDDALQAVPLPPDDSWEKWNEDRDRVYDAGSPQSQQYLPPNVALAAPDLDSYGTWDSEATYGHVWYPRETEAGWRPYHNGHWVWVDPFGWTWVGSEAWGWAPYHYGTWVHGHRGWGWCPGPAQQCWSPAVVSFSSYNGSVAWAPLAPEEVVYPSRLAIGFSGGDWSVLFSIGGCGAYYPGPNHRCYDQAWNNVYINRATYVTNYNGYGGRPFYATNRNSYLGAGAWTPRNARFGGGSIVAANGFAGSGRYSNVSRSNIAAFQHGRAIGVPGRGFAPSVGPSHVRPTLASLTPGRSFSHVAVPAAVAGRSLYRSALNSRVAGASPNFGNRLSNGAAGRANMAGHPGVAGANMANNARLANHAGAPGAAGVRNINRPGTAFNGASHVPASVQAARKTVGVGNSHLTSTAGHPNVRTVGAKAQAHTGVATNHTANVQRNTTEKRLQTAHSIGTTPRTGSFHNTTAHASNHTTSHTTNNVAHRTTTRTNNSFAHSGSTNHGNSSPARIVHQPSVQHNNTSFAHNRVSSPSVQNHNFNTPHNTAPHGGSFSRPAVQQSNPRGSFGGGGGHPQPSAPRGGPPAGGGGHPGGGGGHPGGGGGGREKRG